MFLDKREYIGSIYTQIEDAVSFVLRNIRLGAKLKGLIRKESYELLIDAIREMSVGITKALSVTLPKNTEVGMNHLNHILFEEYKRLDELCRQIYGSQPGITHYIDDMKGVLEINYRHIPNWKADLKQLIRIRHIRNDLAHRQGAFDEEICTQEDIEWSQEFHERILKRSDPLALLHKYFVAQSQMVKAERTRFSSQKSLISVQNDNEGGEMKNIYFVLTLFFIVTIVLAIVLAIVFMGVIFFGNL